MKYEKARWFQHSGEHGTDTAHGATSVDSGWGHTVAVSLVSYPICLRTPYVMSGTAMAYCRPTSTQCPVLS
eukprot:464963-Rhodomonas_salina.2